LLPWVAHPAITPHANTTPDSFTKRRSFIAFSPTCEFFNSRRNRSFALLQVRGYSTGQFLIIQLSCDKALHEKTILGTRKDRNKKEFPGVMSSIVECGNFFRPFGRGCAANQCVLHSNGVPP
jgi:hypothetical protein